MRQDRFDASLRVWLDRQDPPQSAERVAAAIVREVARTNQGAPVLMGILPALGLAAVMIGLVILAGLELRPPVGEPPSVAPTATQGATIDPARLPPGATVVEVGSRAWGNLSELVASGDLASDDAAVWVRDPGTHMTRSEITRIDPVTNEATTLAVREIIDAALQNGELWALMGDQPVSCCEPAPLVQLDAASGEVVRSIDGVAGLHLTLDDGTAWITDERSLVRVDLASGGVLTTIDVPDPSTRPMVFAGSVWLRCECDEASLLRVDPIRAEVTASLVIPGLEFIAGGEGAIWAKTNGALIEQQGGPADAESQILRIDPTTMDVTATLEGFGRSTSYGALTVSHGYVWTPGVGTLLRIDPSDDSIAEVATLPWAKFPGMAVIGDELWMSAADAQRVIHFPLPLP